MQTFPALSSQFSEVREAASQRTLAAAAIGVGLASVTTFAIALFLIVLPA